jgi:Bacteriophage baseplate protein W
MASLNEIKGVKWPFQVGSDGKIAMSEGLEHLRENIARIILTRPGEIPFLSSWGCSVANRAFSPTNAGGMATHDIKRAVTTYEPRVEITEVAVDMTRITEGILGLNIEFKPLGMELLANTFVQLGR